MTARKTAWLVVALFSVAMMGVVHSAPPTAARVVMIDSSAAALAATKRVAISSVMISFQASAGGEKTNTSGLFAAKTDASSSLQMPEMDISIGEIYGLPGLEVELAKELNANLVKATYVVTLGSAKAAVERFSSTAHNNYTGSAFAQVGLRAGQTRIAFRTPSASAKGESAPGGYTANFANSAAPAKDGNVVVSLGEPLLGGTDFFAVTEPDVKKPSLLGGMLGGGFGNGADVQFTFIASVSDAAAYRAEVVSMARLAQQSMLALVKQ